jgi:F-type H+-transporting ATPase subunit b
MKRKAAIIEVKNSVGNLALEIAEKVIRKELKGDKEQSAFVDKIVDDFKLN